MDQASEETDGRRGLRRGNNQRAEEAEGEDREQGRRHGQLVPMDVVDQNQADHEQQIVVFVWMHILSLVESLGRYMV